MNNGAFKTPLLLRWEICLLTSGYTQIVVSIYSVVVIIITSDIRPECTAVNPVELSQLAHRTLHREHLKSCMPAITCYPEKIK